MEEEKKIGFFKRVKMAIFNLEDYKIFAKENFSKALKYLLILIAIITLILSISNTISFKQEFDKLVSYLKNEFPDFSYSDETLNVDGYVEAYDEEYEAKLIVDTRKEELTEEELNIYKEKAEEGYYSFILLKDKAYYTTGEYEYQLTYSDVLNNLGIENITKQELFENYLNDDGLLKITIVIFIYAIIYLFVTNILTLLEDVLIIALFGWIACKICKVNLKFSKICSLAIYSVTLSLILSTVYSVIYTFTNFEIKYFSLMYMIIAYIYIIAAIMIIKEDVNKSISQEVPIEVEKVTEEKTKVEEEKEERDKDDKEEKKEKEREKDKNRKKKKDKLDKEDQVEGEEIPDGK